MGAGLDDTACAEDDDLIGFLDGGESVGNDDGGTACHNGVYGMLDDFF